MGIRSEEMAYAFDALPIKNKIGFYWKDLSLDSVVYVPEWNSAEFRHKNYFNYAHIINGIVDGLTGAGRVNWMKVLLHQQGYRRVE